jgi:23S rRNA pseudouridine1911/1915/1917 synthase
MPRLRHGSTSPGSRRSDREQVRISMQRRTIEADLIIGPELSGMRIDRVASEVLPEFSRTQLSGWIKAGYLTVDGKVVAPKHRVTGGERLRLEAELPGQSAWHTPQRIRFTVVYEDDDLLVIDKPAGVVVHPGAGNPDQTLVNGLLAHRPALGALPRAGLVHRLDKDTSGLMIVAATPTALRDLIAALAQRRIERRYCAVAEGVLSGGRDIEAPIGRDPHDRLRQRVVEGGRFALTHVRVRERFRAHTLIEAKLSTGRTHQIRVHLSAIGYPLLGDRRYGARGRLPPSPSPLLVATVQAFRRQALHAEGLVLAHPLTGAALAFESPPPIDFLHLLAALREDHRERR